jgi:hypothetical protein
MNTIHFSNHKFINDNEHINTFIIINNSLDKQIDSTHGFSIPLSEIDDYDVIFIANKITNHNNILYVIGSVGYSFDPVYIELIYDLNKNIIHVTSDYRLLDFQKEYELYKNTYQISYDKYLTYKTENIEEIPIKDKYSEISEKSIPYYRFPRSKDGISIPRVIYNIFKVFSSSESEKPYIIIPINFNIYRKIIK